MLMSTISHARAHPTCLYFSDVVLFCLRGWWLGTSGARSSNLIWLSAASSGLLKMVVTVSSPALSRLVNCWYCLLILAWVNLFFNFFIQDGLLLLGWIWGSETGAGGDFEGPWEWVAKSWGVDEWACGNVGLVLCKEGAGALDLGFPTGRCPPWLSFHPRSMFLHSLSQKSLSSYLSLVSIWYLSGSVTLWLSRIIGAILTCSRWKPARSAQIFSILLPLEKKLSVATTRTNLHLSTINLSIASSSGLPAARSDFRQAMKPRSVNPFASSSANGSSSSEWSIKAW